MFLLEQIHYFSYECNTNQNRAKIQYYKQRYFSLFKIKIKKTFTIIWDYLKLKIIFNYK